MITIETVKIYLALLPNTAAFSALKELDQDKHIFAALELLKDNFPIEKLTDRAVALQVLFMIEGEEEEFAKLQRQGVKSYSVKGVSVTFDGKGIAPSVIDILVGKQSAMVGRLI